MTEYNDKQYRPLSILETGYQNALTVRFYRDMNSNLLNFKSKCSNHKLVQENWSEGCDMESSALTGGNLETEELIKMPYAPRYLPNGYTRLLVQSIHVRTAGTGETTWRLRVIRQFNQDTVENCQVVYSSYLDVADKVILSNTVFDPSHYPEVRTAEWISDSSSLIYSVSIAKSIVRTRRSTINLILTSQNSDDTTQSKLYSLDVTPLVGE